MNIQIDSHKLLPLIKAFSQLTGMKIAIYDSDFEEVLTYPEGSCAFCEEIWRSNGGRASCDLYTAGMCKKCQDSQQTIVYTCHAGLTEVVSPLAENGIVIGYAVCGQVTNQQDRSLLLHDVLHRCSKLNIAPTRMEQLLEDVKYCTDQQIESTLQIINVLVSYIVLQKMVYISDKPMGLQIAQYISDNLISDLSVDALCHTFAMSRSRLYLVTQDYMPEGIAKYVKKCRIQAAQAAIEANPRKPLWEISQEVGFDSYEYFLRVFKKETGASPVTKKGCSSWQK